MPSDREIADKPTKYGFIPAYYSAFRVITDLEAKLALSTPQNLATMIAECERLRKENEELKRRIQNDQTQESRPADGPSKNPQ